MAKISIDEFIRLRNKSWQKEYRPLVDYVITNYYSNLNEVKDDLERLQQLKRNISRWIQQAAPEEDDIIHGKSTKEFREWLKEVKNDLANDIQRLEMRKSRREPKKYKGKHYAITYILDCHATGKRLRDPNEKSRIEEIGEKFTNQISGNTFYKNYRKVWRLDFNKEQTYIDGIGEDWQTVVIELSKHPENVRKYLIEKKLLKIGQK